MTAEASQSPPRADALSKATGSERYAFDVAVPVRRDGIAAVRPRAGHISDRLLRHRPMVAWGWL